MSLTITDNGVGMDASIVMEHLLKVGASYYDTNEFRREYTDFAPISKFGIGILTCFMVSDNIEIISCRGEEGLRIAMTQVDLPYLLQNIKPGNPLFDGIRPSGTKVIIKLRSRNIMAKKEMLDIVKHWVILPECSVVFREKGKDLTHIGYKSVKEALKSMETGEKGEHDSSYDIIDKTERGPQGESYEMAFKVTRGMTPEKNFTTSEVKGPAVCIEGIRVDDKLPGFLGDPGYAPGRIAALLSVKNDKNLRTTVSRMALDKDAKYAEVGNICCKVFFDYIKKEVDRIRKTEGRPLSQASTAARWLYKRLQNFLEKSELRALLREMNDYLPQIVIEEMEPISGNVKRRLITPQELARYKIYWTIESRLCDFLGIISRDMGREISMNEFIRTMAHEIYEDKFMPMVYDAHTVSELLTVGHRINSVEFSRERMQTALKWTKGIIESNEYYAIIKSHLDRDKNDLIVSDAIKKMLKSGFCGNMEQDSVQALIRYVERWCYADIKGDIENVCFVTTRIIKIIEKNSLMGDLIKNMSIIVARLSTDTANDKGSYEQLIKMIFTVQLYLRLWSGGVIVDTYGMHRYGTEGLFDNVIPFLEEMLDKNDLKTEIVKPPTDLRKKGEMVFEAKSYWTEWWTL